MLCSIEPKTTWRPIESDNKFYAILFTGCRFACNELDSKPEDIIRDIYGYACGDEDFSNRCSSLVDGIAEGVGTGQCGLGIGYASKKTNYILDRKFKSAKTVSEYRKFSAFVSFSLILATVIVNFI